MANPGRIAIISQGLFEKSDSIGFDAVFEYKLLRDRYGEDRVKIFSERFDAKRYRDIPIQPIRELWKLLELDPATQVIYHYCDGWPELDAYLMETEQDFILRWHNNTPPWFYGASHRGAVERTIRGFRTVIDFLGCEHAHFWVNSNFTLEQLRVLGAAPERVSVVYPGSRFLESSSAAVAGATASRTSATETAPPPLRLLFVSRVVAHKGHRHMLALASCLQSALARKVVVSIVGRDDAASTYKADLQRLASELDIETDFPGEVSEEELRAEYLAADLFVCLSEHEGFGMPVFEAMRLGVPVLCWGRTALRELMEDHPFTIDDLDHGQAVAAVRMLGEPETHAEVLKIQQALLQTYTIDVVADQIEAALTGRSGPWPKHELEPALAASASHLRARRAAEAEVVDLRFAHPRDIGENYVTLYDVESYEALLAKSERELEFLPDLPSSDDFVFFSPREFMSKHATRMDTGIAFPGVANVPIKGHVIFGPYAKFIRGFFAVEFEIEAEESGDQGTEIEMDVVLEGKEQLAFRRMTARQIRSQPKPRLVFPVTSDDALIEFRIQVTTPGNCNFLFRGVTVRNVRKSVAGLPEIGRLRFLSSSWLHRGLWRTAARVRNPIRSLSAFLRADRFRDRAWWNDAAEAYAAGLDANGPSWAHFVQLGNCLKEARRFRESEAAYQRALDLRPDDRDTHLQIGRLYRAWGKADDAQAHFIKAARPERPMAEAMQELAEDGFDLSSLTKVSA